MELLERIYRIVHAHLSAGRGGAGEDGGFSWEQYAPAGNARRSGSARAAPPQDSRLAGYFANLEVPYGADLETVRRAWRKMLKKYHPDLHGDDPEKRRVANELTAELTKAYRELEKALTNKERH